MNKAEFVNKVVKTANKTIFKAKKKSPEILIITGIVGVITSTVMACKVTPKATEALKETREELSDIHEDMKKFPENQERNFTKEITMTYARAGVKLVKIYAPAAALGALSIASILTSNNILKLRNTSLVAALATANDQFDKYRKHVVDAYGEEVDDDFFHNIHTETIERTIIDENGKETKIKEKVKVAGEQRGYNFIFDEKSSTAWQKMSDYNQSFLRAQENYADNLLKARGYLFLNEVLDSLGMKPTKEGQTIGWICDEDNPTGANYVDFGIHDVYREGVSDFLSGKEKSILLSFNVDGYILDQLESHIRS